MTNWDQFYALTLTMPDKARTEGFLRDLPVNGRVLDFGSGSGRWAAAFHRDRPDLIIDLIDENPPHPSLIPPDWPGHIEQTDFQSFKPTKNYAGIWANDTLFHLARQEIGPVFHALADKLVDGGIMEFTMLKAGPAGPISLPSLSLDSIESMLEREHLSPIEIRLNPTAEYRVPHGKRRFPTFCVRARKYIIG